MNTQNDNKDDLLPCPFCLSKAKRVNWIYVKDVECTVCKAIAPTAIWNNRSKPPADSEMVEKVAKAIRSESGGGTPYEVFERMAKAAIAALSNGSATGEGVDEENKKETKPLPAHYEEVLRSEVAAYKAVYEAAHSLSRLMDEVQQDDAGQNDRVFAHFEFDQLRHAMTLVDALKASCTIAKLDNLLGKEKA